MVEFNIMERESRLKILIHDPYPARKNSPDGVSNYIREIIPHLEGLGCRVRLVAPFIKDRENDIADYNLGIPRKFSLNKRNNLHVAVSFNKRRAHSLIKTVKPDLIIVHEPSVPNSAHTIISAIPKGEDGQRMVPVIGQFHARTEVLDRKTQILLGILQVARRPKFRAGLPVGVTPGPLNTLREGLSGRIAISQATADFWNKYFPGDYRVIYNGIDVEYLTSEGSRIESWQDGKKTILFAGRHDERKGIEYLLRAYLSLRNAGVDNIKLKLTGNGKLTKMLIALVKKEEIPDVEFLGVLSREDLIKAYRSADVFVAPSIGGEGFNRTIAEARACGALVVCSDIEGHREAIGEDLSPFMARPLHAVSLAEKINTILNLPQESKDEIKAKTSIDAREKFAWEKIAGENVKYYDEVLVQHGKLVRQDWTKKKKTIWSRIPILGTVFVNVRQKS